MSMKNMLNKIRNSEEFWTLAYLAALTYVISLVFFTLLFLVAPLLVQTNNFVFLGVGSFSYYLVSLFYMCHQLPERSLFLLGVQFAICARCVGIYLGGSLGGLLALYHGRPKWLSGKMLLAFFIVLTVPMALDGITQTLLYQRESSNLMRLVTGLLFGFGVLYAITSVISRKAKALSAQLKDVSKIAFGVNAVMIAIILVYSIYYGSQYMSKQTALNSALEYSNVNPVQTIVIYIPPNAVRNIKNDPYLKSYNDVILADMLGVRHDNYKNGVWVVALLGEPASHKGKTVFLSETKGTYVYIDAWTGRVIQSLKYS